MTIPAIDSIDTFGGALNDYVLGVVDPTTDRPASGANQAYAGVAMMTHTAARCWATFVTAATTGAMTIADHDAVWGTSVAPTPARTSQGIFTLTWPATVADELDVNHSTNLRVGSLMSISGATALHVQVARTSATVITVRVYDTTFTLVDAVGTTIGIGGY